MLTPRLFERDILVVSPNCEQYLLNDTELFVLQADIYLANESGWYILFNGQQIDISKEGNIEVWPDGMADKADKAFQVRFGF
jgi:hypothetical protein